MGAFGDPGPGVVLPGAQGLATVAEVPAGCDVLEVDPTPLVEELVPVVVLLPAVVVVVPLAVVVPLLEGVQGAVVRVVADPVEPVAEGVPVCPVVVPWFCVPRVPPVVLPGLPATPGAPELMAGDPVELAPGVVVVVLWPVVPGVVLVVPVVPGVPVVVVPGCDVLVCEPMPGLGVTVPVFWACATPNASASTEEVNNIFRMEACSLLRIAAAHPRRKYER